MLVFGTQMHIVTFLFVCVEIVILFYLVIYRLARPDDKAAALNIILIILLLVYNITGGLLPDPNLQGSYFLQESIAYGTGFITPCYFPYYVFKGFDLKKMRFHAFRGIYLCLMLPYFMFVLIFYKTGNIDKAKDILVIPALYALWVLYGVWNAIRFKYATKRNSKKSIVELLVLFISLTPWVGLPFIAFFNLSQVVEAATTNTGFLLLLAFHLKRNVEQIREEHSLFIQLQSNLLNWNEKLQEEVNKRTEELEQINAQDRIIKNCRLHSLTNRETEIAQFICKGFAYKQIADTIFIAERTVAKHVQNIFEKVQVNNRFELCAKLEKYTGFTRTVLKINKK